MSVAVSTCIVLSPKWANSDVAESSQRGSALLNGGQPSKMATIAGQRVRRGSICATGRPSHRYNRNVEQSQF